MERLWTDAEQAYRSKILAAVPRDASVQLLDLGCDEGSWTDEVRRTIGIDPDQVHGLEIDAGKVARARTRGFEVTIADIEEDWPLERGSFDVVHANQVIEHVKRLDHFAQETKRVLARRGLAVVCTENLASWHNVGALALGYQPFSVTNISSAASLGNPYALHADEPPRSESWQHVHVVTLPALQDIFLHHGFEIVETFGAGYHPFSGRVAAQFAELDPRHAHFIGVVARVAG